MALATYVSAVTFRSIRGPMKNTTVDIRPVSAAVGAEIHNIDLA
jgi:hypothetical protein